MASWFCNIFWSRIAVPVRDSPLSYRLLARVRMPLSDFLLRKGDLFSNVPKSKVNISYGIKAGESISKGLLGEHWYFFLQIDCYLCFPLLYHMKKILKYVRCLPCKKIHCWQRNVIWWQGMWNGHSDHMVRSWDTALGLNVVYSDVFWIPVMGYWWKVKPHALGKQLGPSPPPDTIRA